MVARGWKERRMEFRVSLRDDENTDFKIDCGDGCTIHRYTKNYQIVHFKWLSFMVCELYLNLLFKKNGSSCSSGSKINLTEIFVQVYIFAYIRISTDA